MLDDFCVFILTHERADKLFTLKSLLKAGYTGKYYLILDNEDKQTEKYKELYGDENIIIFDKQKAYNETDTFDNFNIKEAIVYARNECYKIAKDLNIKYFLQLDDDYDNFRYRYEEQGRLGSRLIKNFDAVCESFIKCLEATNADTICFSQGGDLIGGMKNPHWGETVLRKGMNSFFCKTENVIEFKGTMNEDVTAYVSLGNIGRMFFTFMPMMLNQKSTQSLRGGMTEVYRDGGTYLKSFYTIMSMPSAVRIGVMGPSHKRIHHKVYWDYAVPVIINERYKKK